MSWWRVLLVGWMQPVAGQRHRNVCGALRKIKRDASLMHRWPMWPTLVGIGIDIALDRRDGVAEKKPHPWMRLFQLRQMRVCVSAGQFLA
ncbi:hypothetical protein J8I26_08915 [Herbaspirillum sp. LeCh32-8]|uniref:hypothetical protein n=1 Tax=Herbaspirillum sp. LeCh32-8 TaxID=2821356 RepID=UPI001AE83952|nr:hypothetical protein [Herbaspirillum sp. LeCh32-8]MBP0598221.1 hypothetical protein [Herbaspirillum sp. LeCh32-8]